MKSALKAGDSVTSVDTKKKELIGEYANGGRPWRIIGTAARVSIQDSPGPEVP